MFDIELMPHNVRCTLTKPIDDHCPVRSLAVCVNK
jgi:hypothetical protein